MTERGQAGFTLLECMIALLLLATAVTILVQAQTQAVRQQQEAVRIDTATMLAQDLMTELEIRMEREGFGEIEIKERGDFNDYAYADQFDEYSWEYEIETVDLELPSMSSIMGMAGDGLNDATGGAAGPGGLEQGNELAALGALGLDFSMFSEMLGKYVREARVRVCWEEAARRGGSEGADCVELITHLTNPTGKVLTAEEQEVMWAEQEDGSSQPPPRR